MLTGPGTIPADQTPVMTDTASTAPPIEMLGGGLTAHGHASESAVLESEDASIFVYSSDPAFQSGLEDAARDDYSLTPVEEWAELVKAVESGRAKIVLLDADALRGRVEWRIARLKAAAEWCVIVIAATRDRAPYLMELLWQHQIHRLVIKPLGLGVSRILMESAVARFRQLRDDPSERDRRPEEEESVASAWIERLRSRNVPLLVTYASLAVAFAIMVRVVIVPVLNTPSSVPAVGVNDEPAVPTVTETPQSIEIARLLGLAGEARTQGWIVSPDGQSALDHYAAILAIDPSHAEATTELGALLDDLYARAEAEMLAESLDLAGITLEQIRRIRPEDTRLAFLDRQLELAFAQSLSEPGLGEFDLSSPMPVVAAVPALSELDSLLTVAEVRLQNGQLLAPAGDSAFDYLRRAEALSGDDAIVVDIRQELADALSAEAFALFDQGDFASAEVRIAAAVELGADPEPLAGLDGDIAETRATAAADAEAARLAGLMADAQERLQQGLLVDPEDDSAIFYLSALRSDSPEYPELDAAWQQLSDSVAASAAEAIGAGDWETGEVMLASLETISTEPEVVSELGAELERSRLRQQLRTEPAAPSELVLVESTPLVYPLAALQASIEGWVDLEFVVGLDGLVSEATVVGAEPEGEFEQAAIDAVSSYRYEPFVLDGLGYERLLSLRIRFAIQ
ncbi:MAG: TonB family protein [Gammaproteobacteria bacterium]